MSVESLSLSGHAKTVVEDWSSDKQAFNVPWGKFMMWMFLVSDSFIFSCFLVGYMNVRRTNGLTLVKYSRLKCLGPVSLLF